MAEGRNRRARTPAYCLRGPAGRRTLLHARPGRGVADRRLRQASGGLRLLRAPEVLRPQSQARHRRAGSLAGGHLRRRLRADLRAAARAARSPSTRRAAPSTGPWTPLARSTGSVPRPSSPGPSPPTARATRTRWPVGWASCTSSGTTTCTPSYRQFEQRDYLSSSCHDPQDLLQDAAPPRPHAHLAEPRRWQGPHQLVRRSAPRTAPRPEPTPPASRPPRSPCATADRCRSRTAGSAVRCASAPGCARTSRLCGHR